MRIMQTHRPMLLHNVSQRSQDIHRGFYDAGIPKIPVVSGCG